MQAAVDARERQVLFFWFCANCEQPVDIGVHGRCDVCDSDAITTVFGAMRPGQSVTRTTGENITLHTHGL
jgi:hypothetical protein